MPHRIWKEVGASLMPPRRPERTIAVALLAILVFNQPLLRIFDRGPEATVAGVPLLYVYLFAAWALVIALQAVAIERRVRQRSSQEADVAGNDPPKPSPAADTSRG